MTRRIVTNPRQNKYFYRNEKAGIVSLSEAHQCTVHKAVRMHSHSNLQILGILDGEHLHLETPRKTFALLPGYLSVIPAGVEHRFLTDPSSPAAEFLDILISPQQQPVLSEYLHEFAKMKLIYGGSLEELLPLRDDMRRIFKSRTPSLATVMERIWRMVTLIEKEFYHPDKNAADNQPDDIRIRLAENTMDELLDENISIPDIASKVGLSVSQLTRLYIKEFKTTPGKRLREKRLRRAKEFLVASQLSIKQIALACGFENPNHFCRLFKKHNQISPGQYRGVKLNLSPDNGDRKS